MTREEFAVQLKRFISRNERFLLSGHQRPDGDAVGSTTALALALQSLGKEAIIVFDGDPGRYTSIVKAVPSLPEDVMMKDAGKCFHTGTNYAFIMLDCSEPQRTGRAKDAIMTADTSLTIDHHITFTDAADFCYSEPETSSASEILYGMLKLIGIEIDPDMANALFMGIAYDTGGFRHSNVQASTLKMAAELRSIGVDTSFYMNYLFYSRKMTEAKAYAAAVRKAKIVDGWILVSTLTEGEFIKAGTSSKFADGVVGQLLEIDEAKVVVFLREIEGGSIRANMRSKCPIDVARIASLFGGGGHIKAAGCTLQEPMLLAEQHILEAIRRQSVELKEMNNECK